MKEDWKISGIANKFPTYRNSKLIIPQSWLIGKRVDDEAEGLWRINDSIYDLTNFIDRHPGGSFWIRETKGTDITEAFAAHHMSEMPAKILEKFKLRDAAKPRIYTLTLHENGFYKTLKSRVQEKLKQVDFSPSERSNNIHLGLLLSTFLLSIASVILESKLLIVLSGLSLCWTTISAHNFFHRKDNWRMYTFNLSLMNFHEWRISHALSHHIYPNSFLDLELSMFEPFLCWVPNPHIKSLTMRYVSWMTGPITYLITFFLEFSKRIIYSLVKTNVMHWHDVIALSLPLSMYIFSDLSLFACFRHWIAIIIVASFIFSIIGLNAAHHSPEIYHDGDANRADRDWGLFLVDTIIDRSDLKGSQFLVLTHFGDHVLHHLFPTLDHGILPQLYPILYETLNEFKAQLRECNHLQHIIGQHKQLLRTEPNKRPPGGNGKKNL